MSKILNPFSWYWVVNGDESKVYSSALGDYVPANNQSYVDFRADGTLPARIGSEAELGSWLSDYYPNVARPVPAAILDGYQQSQADGISRNALNKLLFAMVNDIRVLKGQAPFTVPQARAYFKGLM